MTNLYADVDGAMDYLKLSSHLRRLITNSIQE
jgi:hypothetical protein